MENENRNIILNYSLKFMIVNVEYTSMKIYQIMLNLEYQ